MGSRRGLLRLVVSLVVVNALLAGQSRAQDVEDLVRQLGDADGRTRHDAYRKLRQTRPAAAPPLLVKALPGYPLAAKDLGMSLLGLYPSRALQPLMMALAKEPSPYLKLCAATWLQTRRHALRSPDVELRIVEALGAAESPREVQMMLDRVAPVRTARVAGAVLDRAKRGEGLPVLDAALRHLMVCRYVPAVSGVREMLRGAKRNPEERAVCLAFLVAMGSVAKVEARGVEKADNEALARAILESKNLARLEHYLRGVSELSRPVLSALLEFASTKTGREVVVAVKLLSRHPYSAALPKLRELIEHEDDQVSKAAFDALMKLSGQLDAKLLRGLLSSRKPRLVTVAADALRRLDDDAGLPRLVALAGVKDDKARREVIEAIGKFRDRRAVPILISALDDSDASIRRSAQSGLQRILRGLLPYRRLDFRAAGYEVKAPVATRRAAVAQIRHWWKLVDAK